MNKGNEAENSSLRTRRIKSVLVSLGKINDLKQPVNKIIKPTQIYYDSPYYKINHYQKDSDNRKINVFKRDHSADITTSCISAICNCDCHRSPIKQYSESTVTTANSKRSKIITASPIKLSGREIISRRSDQRKLINNPIFPYGLSQKNTQNSAPKRKGISCDLKNFYQKNLN